MPPQVGPASWEDLIRHEAEQQKVDPQLALAVAQTESSMNANTPPSSAGALGLFQLMPETAQRLGVDPTDPVQNIHGGVAELGRLLNEQQSNVKKALRLYNASPGTPDSVTDPYVQKVFKNLSRYQVATPPGPTQPSTTLQPVASHVGTPPPAPSEEGWGDWAWRQAKGVGKAFNPLTEEGQLNLAGGVGAAGGAILASPTAAVSGPIGPGTGAVLGAMTAAGMVKAGRQLFGADHTIEMGDVGSAMTQQGLQEMLGQGTATAVINPIGRRLLGARVAQYAGKKLAAAEQTLSATKQVMLGRLERALAAADQLAASTRVAARQATARTADLGRVETRGAGEAADQALAAARTAAAGNLRAARTAGSQRVAAAKSTAAQGVGQAEQARIAAATAAQAPYTSRVNTPPDAALAGRQVLDLTFEQGGAAKVAKDVAGQAVEQAAESGPPVPTASLRDRLVELSNQMTPSVLQDGDPTRAGIGSFEGYSVEQAKAILARNPDVAQALALVPPELHLPAALSYANDVVNSGDTIPFADAHKVKRLLDEVVHWDQTARTSREAATKGFRGTLRELMRGHAPYDAAAAHYKEIAPWYGKSGIAGQLRKVGQTNPEKIVPLLNAKNPTRAAHLVHLLTTQAEAGGDAEGGQAALEAVQAAWIHQNLIQGGINKLGDRLAKLHGPQQAFRDAFLGGAHASEILGNLQQISEAYQAAISREGITAAKTAGQQGVEAATATARAGLDTARADAARRVAEVAGQGRATVAGTQDLGVQGTRLEREMGTQAVEQAQRAKGQASADLVAGRAGFREQEKALRGEQKALARSSLLPKGSQWADVMRAVVLAPKGEFWGFVSLVKLMHGPTAQDLTRWAAASPASTQALVRAINSPFPALAIADLVRVSGILSEEDPSEPAMAPSHGQVGQPIPVQPSEVNLSISNRPSGRVATPPPR